MLIRQVPDIWSSRSEMVTHLLSVSRFHTLSDFEDDDAEAIVEEMSRVLQIDDGGAAPDVECTVEFSLDGRVDTFMVGNGVISDETDFLEVIRDAPGTVKVVFQVNWCFDEDTLGPVDLRNYGACADTSTGSFVVEAGLRIAQAGALWSHEFGHLQSIGHRVGEPLMVMNRIVGPNSRRVDGHECGRFRQ